MKSEPYQAESSLFVRWLRATSWGWLLGFVLILLGARVGDIIFAGELQFIVGVGMGAGVGYAQGRVARAWLGSPRRWWVASTLGMGALFIIHDLFVSAGVHFPFSLPLYVVVGGLFVGFLQWHLLRAFSARANWWVPACGIGWGLPAGAIALGESGMGLRMCNHCSVT